MNLKLPISGLYIALTLHGLAVITGVDFFIYCVMIISAGIIGLLWLAQEQEED